MTGSRPTAMTKPVASGGALTYREQLLAALSLGFYSIGLLQQEAVMHQ
jgi:hypothetical protein